MAENTRKWRFAIDRGGTFTDIIGLSPDGELAVEKVLSESTEYEDAGIEGIRRILSLPRDEILPTDKISWIRMGTTVATNALLQRKGARTGLLITKGFRDILEIGTQDRPDIFALHIDKPQLIYNTVEEIDERTGSDSAIISEIATDSINDALFRFKDKKIESVAIVFLFSWLNPAHERIARDAAINAGFENVSTSHETMPLIKIVNRGRTTLVDAYLAPVISNYARKIRKWVGDIPLFFMSSSGSLMSGDSFTGKDAILSGPAGGVLGVASIAELTGDKEVIGFDMGGTSTDVCRYAGSLERVLDVETAGVKFTTPMIEIQTVAAGGGSILQFDSRKLTVGPESASAEPGPACYSREGPAAITDANLILGRIHPEYFPSVFGADYSSPLDRSESIKRFEEIVRQIEKSQGIKMSVEELALGFIRIANETMSRPIKELSVSRGHDPRTHTLVTFGGAGAQHACGIARALGIRLVRIPPLASLLSAWGILLANHRRTHVETTLCSLNEDSLNDIRKRFEEIKSNLEKEIRDEAGLPDDARFTSNFELDIRTKGTDAALTLPYCDNADELKSLFIRTHLKEYGFKPHGDELEIVNIRVEIIEESNENNHKILNKNLKTQSNKPARTVPVWFESDKPLDTPVYMRDELACGITINGPALIVETHSTIVVEPGFDASLDENGILSMIMRTAPVQDADIEYDPVLLEVFHHLFMGIAEQMGRVLERTAHSVNIKERLDFSCAIFDSSGRLVANAPHIPVHLGAMGETVRYLISAVDKFNPGDFYCSNDPFAGGSHLPDITVVAPVFRHGKIAFYLAARGHHADIGGIMPGSMYPFAKHLNDEGVVLRNLLLVSGGKFNNGKITDALAGGKYPARNIPERISDLKAQVAAVQKGIGEIENLCDEYSDDVVVAYTKHIRDDARLAMKDALENLMQDKSEKVFTFSDYLDSGAKIEVSIRIFRNENDEPAVVVDFTGTGKQLDSSLNAPPAVTYAAVLYVFRTLINRQIPLNDGCLEPIEIIIPKGCLLNPSSDAAVCGGNVETSQRIVDCLFGALNVAAASQGTMNNIAFGDVEKSSSQYYETIAGGSGAVDGFHGASACQVHMTNTRITDPEVIEIRFPQVRLESFRIRKNSGGAGKYRGGDGVIRAYRFLKSQSVSILSERRKYHPFGLNDGQPGMAGENLLIRADGSIEKLDGHFQGIINAGDILEIRTPGGGGFGQK